MKEVVSYFLVVAVVALPVVLAFLGAKSVVSLAQAHRHGELGATLLPAGGDGARGQR